MIVLIPDHCLSINFLLNLIVVLKFTDYIYYD